MIDFDWYRSHSESSGDETAGIEISSLCFATIMGDQFGVSDRMDRFADTSKIDEAKPPGSEKETNPSQRLRVGEDIDVTRRFRREEEEEVSGRLGTVFEEFVIV
ncbi:MAG: hypothetical protein K2Z81_10370, partial [Cyanobacteria bacterium]|nr:hypothetical protein [Cyanobacteriota bacterium]